MRLLVMAGEAACEMKLIGLGLIDSVLRGVSSGVIAYKMRGHLGFALAHQYQSPFFSAYCHANGTPCRSHDPDGKALPKQESNNGRTVEGQA